MADETIHRPARRFLVTGGSGFIGTRLVDHLVGLGHEVLNLDVKPAKTPERERLRQHVDLCDADAVGRAVAGFRPDFVINLAANADVLSSVELMKVNTDGLQNLVDACVAMPAPPRVVHTSTQYVVGPTHRATGPRDYAPYTDYGGTKAKSEELLWRAPATLPWTIVRPSTIWGPHHPDFARTIWRFIRQGLYMLPTGIDPVRSYGYVGNVAHQIVDLALSDPAAIDRQVFYVGDQPVRSSEWLDGFSKRLRGRPVRRVPGAALRFFARLGDVSGKLGGPSPINSGRLFRMTSDYVVPMEPTFAVVPPGPYSIDQGLDETVAWLNAKPSA